MPPQPQGKAPVRAQASAASSAATAASAASAASATHSQTPGSSSAKRESQDQEEANLSESAMGKRIRTMQSNIQGPARGVVGFGVLGSARALANAPTGGRPAASELAATATMCFPELLQPNGTIPGGEFFIRCMASADPIHREMGGALHAVLAGLAVVQAQLAHHFALLADARPVAPASMPAPAPAPAVSAFPPMPPIMQGELNAVAKRAVAQGAYCCVVFGSNKPSADAPGWGIRDPQSALSLMQDPRLGGDAALMQKAMAYMPPKEKNWVSAANSIVTDCKTNFTSAAKKQVRGIASAADVFSFQLDAEGKVQYDSHFTTIGAEAVALIGKYTGKGTSAVKVYADPSSLCVSLRALDIDVYMLAAFLVVGNVELNKGPFCGERGKPREVSCKDPFLGLVFWFIIQQFFIPAAEKLKIDVPGLENSAPSNVGQSPREEAKAMAKTKIDAFTSALGGSAPNLTQYFFQKPGASEAGTFEESDEGAEDGQLGSPSGGWGGQWHSESS